MTLARFGVAALCGGLLLGGCAYQPLPQRDISLAWSRPPGVPPDWICRNGGCYAPPVSYPVPHPSYPSPLPDPPVIEQHTTFTRQPTYRIPNPPTVDEHDDDPPVIPQVRPDPTPAPKLALPNFSPPPLIDIEKSPPASAISPDDACVGAWRICHFFNLF